MKPGTSRPNTENGLHTYAAMSPTLPRRASEERAFRKSAGGKSFRTTRPNLSRAVWRDKNHSMLRAAAFAECAREDRVYR